MRAKKVFLFFIVAALCILLSAHGVEAKKKKKKDAVEVSEEAGKLHNEKPSRVDPVPEDKSSKNKKKVDTAADKEKEREKERELEKEAAARKAAAKKAQAQKEKKVQNRLTAARKRNAKLAEKRFQRITKRETEENQRLARQDKLAKRKLEAEAPANKAKGVARLNWFVKASARSSHNMVHLEEDQWQEYVNSGPRPYWVFLVFTALGSQYNCHICRQVHALMQPIAETYEAKRGVVDVNATLAMPEDNMPIFFAEVDIGRNQNLFNKLRLNNAPVILLVPPRIGVRPVKAQDFVESVRPKYRFNQLQPNMQPDDLAAWINKNRPNAAPVYLEPVISPVKVAAMLTALVVGVFVTLKYGQHMLKLRAYSRLFQIGGLALYLFAISGGMYNIIRDVPFSGNSERGVEYISYGGRDQYAAEGYLMGGANMLAAIFTIFMVKGSFTSTEDKKNTAKGPGRAFRAIVTGLKTVLSPLICLLLAAAFWFQVVTVYTKKNGYYNMGWLL